LFWRVATEQGAGRSQHRDSRRRSRLERRNSPVRSEAEHPSEIALLCVLLKVIEPDNIFVKSISHANISFIIRKELNPTIINTIFPFFNITVT